MSDEVETESVDLGKLTQIYLKIRDAKEVLTQKFKEDAAKLEEQMAVLEQEMLETCKQHNASSIRTPFGTVVRSIKSRYWTNDWDSMYNFVRENDAYGLLERRLHQTNMKQFLEENPDKFPPGMLLDSQYKITIRRSNK